MTIMTEIFVLWFHIEDKVLKKGFVFAGRNSRYISQRMQNEIISLCNDVILEKLANSITRSIFFSMLANETTDISGTINSMCPICR